MTKKYILSFDQGTTSSRAILLDRDGNIRAEAGAPHEQLYPQPGWVSHNIAEIFDNIVRLGKEAVEKAGASFAEVAAIGVTNQRETLAAWDRETGEPACHAVVWQCRRTAALCEKIRRDGMEQTIRKKTGLVVDPYFSATKIRWILDHEPKAQELAEQSRLLVGTMDSYMIWRLTKGGKHVTDYTNASRTMLFNIFDLRWDTELLNYFAISGEMLPEVVPSSGILCETDPEIFGEAIPIAGIAGDQHAALFGQMCIREGDVKNTYGTGCFMLMNIGDKPKITDGNLLTTIAWHMDGKTVYALEGSSFNAGSAVEWLIHEAEWAKDVAEINRICDIETRIPAAEDGVYMVPAFSGLGTPYWDPYARGMLCGLTLSTTRNDIVRAVMEGIALQAGDVLDAMQKEAGMAIRAIKADGGVSQSRFLMQFQADISNVCVERPQNIETTALGAAYLAGLAVSFWKDIEDIRNQRKIDTIFHPQLTDAMRESKYRGWRQAVERSKGWAYMDKNCERGVCV